MTTDPDCIFCKIVAGGTPCFKLCGATATLPLAAPGIPAKVGA